MQESRIIKLDERVRMVKAMEYIARHINGEDIFNGWLMYGVADGDIEYGDLTDKLDIDMFYWIDNPQFSELMQTFLECMYKCKISGGLYCDNVVSGKESNFDHEW